MSSRKVEPLRMGCETVETLLSLMGELRGLKGARRLTGFAGVLVSEDGTMEPVMVGVDRGDLALVGAALTDLALGGRG